MTSRPRLHRWLAAAICLVLGGCAAAIKLAAPEPPQYFELTPKSTFAEDLPEVDGTLVVEVPTATAGLNTARIALRPTPTSLQYYARARWVDVVPVMVQNLLLESFDNTGKIDVLDPAVLGVRADYALITHVREFQAEYEGPGPPDVRVRLQVRLVRLPRRQRIAATSEEFVVGAGATSLESIIVAFDEAFGKATKRIVEWAIRELAALEAGRA